MSLKDLLTSTMTATKANYAGVASALATPVATALATVIAMLTSKYLGIGEMPDPISLQGAIIVLGTSVIIGIATRVATWLAPANKPKEE